MMDKSGRIRSNSHNYLKHHDESTPIRGSSRNLMVPKVPDFTPGGGLNHHMKKYQANRKQLIEQSYNKSDLTSKTGIELEWSVMKSNSPQSPDLIKDSNSHKKSTFLGLVKSAKNEKEKATLKV